MNENQLKPSAQRVQDFLTSYGSEYLVKELPGSTRTARDAAKAIGCEVAQIAKSLIFRDEDSGNPVLIIASGTNRVSLTKVQQATGLKIGKADAEFVRERIGYAIGGVPPVAYNNDVVTILDPDLKKYQTIWAAAGTPNAVFELKPDELDRLTNGRWIPMAE
jgi:prolyl-tRNA editing enzyme YbaK/EbsC (Cys-tRNA(Pro) deacylase)